MDKKGDIAGGSAYGGGVEVTMDLDSIAAGDQFRGAFISGDNDAGGTNQFTDVVGTGTGTVVEASFKHVLSPTWTLNVGGSVTDAATGGTDFNVISGDVVWTPLAGFKAVFAVSHTDMDTGSDMTEGLVRIERTW